MRELTVTFGWREGKFVVLLLNGTDVGVRVQTHAKISSHTSYSNTIIIHLIRE